MKIAVAMSGGVDSSVAALLLKQAGHDVIGLSMQLFDHSQGGAASRCCSGDDLSDARAVAWAVGIRHYVLDFEEIFRRTVREPFVRGYLAGETPIPCIECNTFVKFDPLLDRARALGYDRIATGHYARVIGEPGARRLARAKDRDKDQTYFLYELSGEVLERVEFPLGELTKDEARSLARDAKLPVADKPESQEICFVPPDQSYHEVVDRESEDAGSRAGAFVDAGGRRLGSHPGFHHFTVGQRRGLGQGFGARKYVIEIRPEAREVVLGDSDELFTRELEIHAAKWTESPEGLACSVRLRSRAEEAPATVELRESGVATIRFPHPVRRTAPGQAAVVYSEDRVVGGGRIGRVAPASLMLPSAVTAG